MEEAGDQRPDLVRAIKQDAGQGPHGQREGGHLGPADAGRVEGDN